MQVEPGPVERGAQAPECLGARAGGGVPASDKVFNAARDERLELVVDITGYGATGPQRQPKDLSHARAEIE